MIIRKFPFLKSLQSGITASPNVHSWGNQPSFFFSSENEDEKDKKNNESQQKKSSGFKKPLKWGWDHINNPRSSKSFILYFRKLAKIKHTVGHPFFTNLRPYIRFMSYKQSQGERKKAQSLKAIQKSTPWPTIIIFILFSLLRNSKEDEKKEDGQQQRKNSVSQPVQPTNTSSNQYIAKQILEIPQQIVQEKLARMKKIYIKSFDEFKAESQEQSKNEQSERTKRINLIHYTITMQDQHGKQYIASPYIGNPNLFLKYLEHLHQKFHITEKPDVFFNKDIQYSYKAALIDVLSLFGPFVSIAITLYFFSRMDPTFFLKGFGKTGKQFNIQAMKDIKTRFKDVAGMEQSKKQITQFVDFLKNNEKYKKIGAKIPKGALLTGPPGTGKTMLARACAGQAGVSFFYISGSEFVEVFAGLGASKVRTLFQKARQNAPSIIFIDQIDAIGKKRQTSRNQEKDTTLNQLLVQMDGFSTHETIVVLAATNRKEMLDSALIRPGRFDRIVEINLPDVKAREEIFLVHLAPLKIDPTSDVKSVAKRLAELSPGFSGADISNLCNEAAIIATRKSRQFIVDKDFEEAAQRITAGYIKKNLMKQKNKKRVAYHEAGHAVASWFLKGGDPLIKITIIPRSKGALGYAQYFPKTSYILAKDELIDKVAVMLGGITSEEIFLGQMSSGGSDDLQKVYSLTRRMVTQFGMGNQTYNITLDEESYIQKQSSFLNEKMQSEIEIILKEARKRCRQTLEAKKQIIQALTNQLIKKQTLNSDQIKIIMGQRPDFEVKLVKQAA